MSRQTDAEKYLVLVDRQGQYSVREAGAPRVNGLTPVGPERSKQECLNWIAANWLEMYPTPVRRS